ncbi:hypothetical protein HDV05_004566 [Chytridiales sp. JEL 0842]|nr:hypothetical protein HDV05_004566 [Chytridiales sp. JEL 0842]
MSTTIPYRQDVPPPMPQTIRYKRLLPNRGPSGAAIFTASFLVMGYGWYWMAKSNEERRQLRVEKAWNRLSLVPLLQAETDRDIIRRQESYKSKESAVMSVSTESWAPLDLKAPVKGIGKNGVRDPEAAEPVYHTSRYVAPTFYFVPKEEGGDLIDAQWWRGTKMFTKNPTYHERADWKGKKDPIAEW